VISTATSRLTEHDLVTLERESWIDADTANAWPLYRVSSVEGGALVGRNNHSDYSGIAIPTYWPGESSLRETFLRRDHPEYETKNGGELKPWGKYLAPPGRGNRLVFGPNELGHVLTETVPLLLVEGLKKLISGWRLSRWECETPRFVPCAVTGVWNWRGTIGKTTDAAGARVDIKGVIPDFNRIVWDGRQVLLVYDSDALSNLAVMAAREALAEELRRRGARVVVMFLPALDGLEKTGFDDLCARWGPQAVLDWLESARSQGAAQDDPEPVSITALPVAALPTDEVPAQWLRDEIQAVAQATETPSILPALMATAVLAVTVQRKYEVEVEPGYLEPINVYVAPALPSGHRKTAVVTQLTEPLLEYERKRADELAPHIRSVQADRVLTEERMAGLRSKAKKARDDEFILLKQELVAATERSIPG
jgi:hypothetical protein